MLRSEASDEVEKRNSATSSEVDMARRRVQQHPKATREESPSSPWSRKDPSDAGSIALLMVLYTLQGVPMGLSGAIPLLVAGRANYKAQALFSLVKIPFSLKLLWAPIVDSTHFPGFGVRKSWLVPTQLLIGIVMIASQSSIDLWMDNVNVGALTVLFGALYFLCATQDVAVDGWALTMLSPANVGWGPTCNSLGQSLGYALSYVVFVALHESGSVSLASFVGICGWCFLVTTAVVAFLKTEAPPSNDDDNNKKYDSESSPMNGSGAAASASDDNANAASPTEVYRCAINTLKLVPVRKLCLVLLTCRAGFGAADAVTTIKAVEYGLPREDMALLAPVLLTASIVFPLVFARWTTGPAPLDSFLAAVPIRLALNVWTYVVLEFVKTGRPGRFLAFAILSLVRDFATNLMFVSQMSFFAKVSDPNFGGTYMTLLNTVTNLGAMWPPSLALYLLDPIAPYSRGDPFAAELILTTLLGFAWFILAKPYILNLQALPLSHWRVGGAGEGQVDSRLQR